MSAVIAGLTAFALAVGLGWGNGMLRLAGGDLVAAELVGVGMCLGIFVLLWRRL